MLVKYKIGKLNLKNDLSNTVYDSIVSIIIRIVFGQIINDKKYSNFNK